MSAVQGPQEGVVYTPEQVSKTGHGWLPLSPGAIRRACNDRVFEHVNIRGKIGLNRANILAIQSKFFVAAGSPRKSSPKPRGRRTASVTPLPTDVVPFVSRPEDRRGRRRAS